MKNKQSKDLVIDASVARSCGGEDAKHPTSKNCRKFLEAVLEICHSEICHSMVMTDKLKAEWDKHQSTFARKWRRSMIARRKYKYCKNVTLSELRNKLEQLDIPHKTREAIWKDICLVEAAIATDKIIVSLDDKVRDYLVEVSENIPEVKLILWLNPDKESNSIKWLEDGAILENKRLLGYREESS
ncbi:hypothetical protein [Planktothrix agardhii]|uniref:hypothetical protein n=1 Tax=Planktothrix agardhii TaxID=1160 RepID=UPI0020A73AE3|nr:hypothetical protein [Planktothrix agardhii]CAD5938778.1 hypothetical protein NO758_01767 [Planktothrix agardhii]